MTTTAIPLIDLARWFDGTDADRATLAEEVDAALCRLGFLVVLHHGLDDQVLADSRAAALEFFHRPHDEKTSVALDGSAYRGWVGPGLESNAATYGVDTPPDLKETFAFGPVDDAGPGLRAAHPDAYAPNRWPEKPKSLELAGTAFWRAANALAEELLQLMAMALRLPATTLVDQCHATTSTASFHWYWPHTHAPGREGQFRIGPHTDFGTVTILDREPGIGGLQVRDEAGQWVDAPVVENSLIVNTGDMLRQWTNDRWCSNEHRVLPPSHDAPTEELVSLVFFHEPDAEAIIAPLPTCVSADNPARYEPTSAADYLAAKYRALAVDDAAPD